MKKQARSSKQAGMSGGRNIQDGADSLQHVAPVAERTPSGTMGTVSRLQQFARTSAGVTPGGKKAQQGHMSPSSPQSDGAASIPSPQQHCAQQEGEYSSELADISQNCTVMPGCTTEEPTIKDVFLAVNRSNETLATLSTHVGKVQADISFIRQDLQTVRERLSVAEERISTVEDVIPPLSKEVKTHSAQIAALLLKTDDFENRLRRNNVRLIGVPEKAEGSNPGDFFEQWLARVIGRERLSPLYAVERAHRVPTRMLPPGAPPRPVLVRVLHYKDRDAILRAARDLPELAIDNSRISIFPDFSAEVQRRRMQFTAVKKRFRDLQIPYAMLYPARLRVTALGQSHFFDTPALAMDWLDSHENRLRTSKD